MKYVYFLQILCGEENINEITSLLKVTPTSTDYGVWEYKITQKEDDESVSFIDLFLGILDGKYSALKEAGVADDGISVWMYYEYDQQCNMAFYPDSLKRLGENGIALCITCWESDKEYEESE